jgi:hypothetical protein
MSKWKVERQVFAMKGDTPKDHKRDRAHPESDDWYGSLTRTPPLVLSTAELML